MKRQLLNRNSLTGKIRTGLLLLLQSMIAFVAMASEDPQQVTIFRGAAEIDSGQVRETIDANYYNGTIFSKIKNPANDVYVNTISLFINEDTSAYIETDFSVQVTFTIEWTDKAGSTHSMTDKTLYVDYKVGSGIAFKPRDYFIFDNARKVKVIITGVNITGSLPWDPREILILENRMVVKRDYNFECHLTVDSVDHHVPDTTVNGNRDEITVTWQNPDTSYGITHNDIEWTWVDYEALDRYRTLSGEFNSTLIFKNNSSRVTIPAAESFDIPLFYDGKGYFFYRVRPVQYLENGLIVEGTWSAMDSTNVTYYDYDGYEPYFNWQASTTHAEDGKYQSVLSFFDGTQRGRQTVTKDNTTHTTIVAETFYDYQGRPAINVLPSPTINTVIEYAKNFNKFTSNTYPKDIYDLYPSNVNICETMTAPLDSSSGAAKYYSSNNELVNEGIHKYIPSAFGYPYTETRYTPDATGRIASQGGVGPDHQITTGHETKYFYGAANQQVLDALFGTEVGDVSHYFKTMVKDANGQYSVSYTDMSGRIIATALAGTTPENLDSLRSRKARNVAQDLLSKGNNTIKGRSIEAATTMTVDMAGDFEFHYEISPQSFEIVACNPEGKTVCYNCYYDLEIRITGECGNPVVLTKKNFSFGNYDTTCVDSLPLLSLDTTLALEAGDYSITKTLKLSQHAQDWYRDNIYAFTNICKTIQDYYDDNYEVMIANTNCNITCASCLDTLGIYDTFRARYLTDIGYNPASTVPFEAEILLSYKEAEAACKAMCEADPMVENRLTTIRRMMLQDVTPDMGQYAQLDEDSTMLVNTIKPYNIFNKAPAYNVPRFNGVFGHPLIPEPPRAPAIHYPLNPDGSQEYRNEAGQRDPDMTVNPPRDPSYSFHQEFTRLFKPSWAESLLPSHPEYKKLRYAETNLASSYVFDEEMENTASWADAWNAGYLDMDNLLATDPFFTGVGNTIIIEGFASFFAPRVSMNRMLKTNYSNTGRTMLQVAWTAINCTSGTCTVPTMTGPDPGDCEQDWDKVWIIFRTAYIAEKDKLVNQLIERRTDPILPAHVFEEYGYIRRFIDHDDLTSGANVQNVNAQLEESFETTCTGYIEMWRVQLETCDTLSRRSDKEAIINDITQQLKEVCKRGSDLDHPFGASTVRPEERGTSPTSFEEVIKAAFLSYGIPTSAVCHPYMIDYPQPYEYQSPVSDGVVIEVKDTGCVCKRLKELEREKGSQDISLSEFIKNYHGVDVRQSLIDSLNNGCTGVTECVFYNAPIQIPAILDCSTNLNNCIDCKTYHDLRDTFLVRHPSIDSVPHANPQTDQQVNENNMFAQFMNTQTGFHKLWSDYLQFQLECEGYENTLSCDSLQHIIQQFYAIHGDSLYGATCEELFTTYVNSLWETSYTYAEIQTLFVQYCGTVPEICRPRMNCELFQQVIDSFYVRYGQGVADSIDCQGLFIDHFNEWFDSDYNWPELQSIFTSLCGGQLDVCNPVKCDRLQQVLDNWKTCHSPILADSTCINEWVDHFNTTMGTSYDAAQIDSMYNTCGIAYNPCQPDINCLTLRLLLQSYYNLGDSACASANLDPEGAEYCEDCFAWYINSQLGTSYSYSQIVSIYRKACNTELFVCKKRFDCKLLSAFNNNFNQWYSTYAGEGRCDSLFIEQFNQQFSTSYSTLAEVKAIYKLYCGAAPVICDSSVRPKPRILTCLQIDKVYRDFKALYPMPLRYFGDSCQQAFTIYFNNIFGSSLSYMDIVLYYKNLCKRNLDVCLPDNSCDSLQSFLTRYSTEYEGYNLPGQLCRDLFTKQFNAEFKPKALHTWIDIQRMYAQCGDTLDICPDIPYTIACENLEVARKAFYIFYNGRLPDTCDKVFTRFFNLYFGTSFSSYEQVEQWAQDNCGDTLNICGLVNPPRSLFLRTAVSVTPPVNVGPRLCDNVILPPADTTGNPCDFITEMSLNASTEQYNVYVQQQYDKFDSIYISKCITSLPQEVFTVKGLLSEYHYTLYYYDRAGNLVKTVPPEGVDERRLLDGRIKQWHDSVQEARELGTEMVPPHTLKTEYRYNTLNQVVAQISPDGGLSKFYYDRLGRLVISQNAKQEPDDKYSYTKYDEIGRIKEVGQIEGTTVTQALTQNPDNLATWFEIHDNNREQITSTVYDLPADICDISLLCQANLRNRVSYTTLTDLSTDIVPASASYFSYDIHGNVDTLLQYYGKGVMAEITGNSYKRIIYDYDIISGKVEEVAYQKGLIDEFYHRYEYDAKNRLTEVYTSHDHVYWERQAKYDYYKHGPLARSEIGQLGVQGVDYAYTIHGWLKGVNSSAIAVPDIYVAGSAFDMGSDGAAVERTARDAFAFNLNYYSNLEYKAIKPSTYPFAEVPFGLDPQTDAMETGVSLFNGNIASMMVSIPKVGEARLYAYRYDQLNRIKGMNSYIGLDSNNNIFTPSGSDNYRERVTYDGNGNILSYLRNGSEPVNGTDMDELTYQYPKDANNDGKLINNRLRYVHDEKTGSYTEDIKTQTILDQRAVEEEQEPELISDNYHYDAIGNLIRDSVEHITNISWTVYGKISSITKVENDVTTTISYTYDPAGNRISKKVTIGEEQDKWTWYVRDAAGNVMAVYQKDGTELGVLTQTEVHLYGSSRLGIWRPTRDVESGPWYGIPTESMPGTNGLRAEDWQRGYVQYELSNHLGNVLVTVSDKKLQVQDSGDPALIAYYDADVVSANDYYPFGMGMPGRKWSAEGAYRYGFNGKENDDEVKGEGNQQDYGMRVYDTRLGRFLSVDPLAQSFPWYTPYQFAGNTPIQAIDLDGAEPVTALRFLSKTTTRITGVSWGAQYNGMTHTVGITKGIAVDPHGNVLAFSQSAGLAATPDFLFGGKSADMSIGLSVGFSIYNNSVTKLEDLLGGGKTLSAGIAFFSGSGEFTEDMKMQGATIQIGISFGEGVAVSAQNTNTTGIIFTGAEYDKFEADKDKYETQAYNDAKAYDFQQALLAGEEKYNRKDYPWYAGALWQSKSYGMDITYEKVGDNRYEIVYQTYLIAYANEAVRAQKGLFTGGAWPDMKIPKSAVRSGIFLTKDDRGNFISEAYTENMGNK